MHRGIKCRGKRSNRKMGGNKLLCLLKLFAYVLQGVQPDLHIFLGMGWFVRPLGRVKMRHSSSHPLRNMPLALVECAGTAIDCGVTCKSVHACDRTPYLNDCSNATMNSCTRSCARWSMPAAAARPPPLGNWRHRCSAPDGRARGARTLTT